MKRAPTEKQLKEKEVLEGWLDARNAVANQVNEICKESDLFKLGKEINELGRQIAMLGLHIEQAERYKAFTIYQQRQQQDTSHEIS